MTAVGLNTPPTESKAEVLKPQLDAAARTSDSIAPKTSGPEAGLDRPLLLAVVAAAALGFAPRMIIEMGASAGAGWNGLAVNSIARGESRDGVGGMSSVKGPRGSLKAWMLLFDGREMDNGGSILVPMWRLPRERLVERLEMLERLGAFGREHESRGVRRVGDGSGCEVGISVERLIFGAP